MTNPKLTYGRDYLNWWYFGGGFAQTILGKDVQDQIKKAVGVWDAPTSPYDYYFEPKFSATVQIYTIRVSEVFKLLRKTTFQAEGDSLKYVETDLSSLVGFGAGGTPFTTGTAESAPTVATLEEFQPAYMADPWTTDLTTRTRASWQADPKLNPEWVKAQHVDLLPSQIDLMLNKTVDTVANDGSTNLNFESIDRICSGYAEASTTYCSSADDPDVYWGKASALIDRSGDSDDTFGCGAGSGLSLPSSAAARILKLDYIDDVVAAASNYSKRKRYIAITGPKTLNEMQKLIDPKQRYLDVPMDVQITENGVQTRQGAKVGFQIASYLTNGIQIPFFTSSHIANELAANRSATITDADCGNIFIIDLDTVEVRYAIPITYMETPAEAMLTRDNMSTRHMFLFAGQLLCTNFRANAAIKYLKTT